MKKCAYVVIGAGSTGLRAVELLKTLQRKVILIEASEIGSDQQNGYGGFVQYLQQSSQQFQDSLHIFREYPPTFLALQEHRKVIVQDAKKQAIADIEKLESDLHIDRYVEIVRGQARFISPTLIEVVQGENRHLITFEQCLVTIGKQELLVPEIPGLHETPFSTRMNIFENAKIPKSIAIIGFSLQTARIAEIYANLGVKVHIVDSRSSVECLKKIDKTVQNIYFKSMLQKQVEFHFSTPIEHIEKKRSVVRVLLPQKKDIKVEEIYVDTEKVFYDTIGASLIGLKSNVHGLIVDSQNKVSGSQSVFAFGEANSALADVESAVALEKFASSQFSERRNSFHPRKHYLALSSQTKISKEVRILSPQLAVTIGMTEDEAVNKYGPQSKSSVKTYQDTIIKYVINSQSDAVLGISIGGKQTPALLPLAHYVVEKKRTSEEIDSYLNALLEYLHRAS